MSSFRAALIQMSTGSDKEKNVEKAASLVREAAQGGAKLVCLQELFNTIYFPFEIDQKYMDLAEPIPGPASERMSQVAKEVSVTIVAPIYEKAMDGLLYNSAAVIGPDGGLSGVYRKSSIPFAHTESIVGIEKYYFAPGDTGFLTFATPEDVRFGTLICYDRHFPEAARSLAIQGAQLILVPTATTGHSRDIWELELRGHAVANICYVGGVNRVGVDEGGDTRHWFGSSVWVDPKGQIIAQASDTDDEILYANLDFSIIPELRNTWGFFRDRRPDLYGDLTRSGP